MVRTQIQLTEQQARRLRTHAREQGISLAEVIRRYIDKGIADEDPDRQALYERASRVVGRFPDRGGKRDLSRRHDHYLDEAFE
jgi:Ribbon-helix-helix protein, copG family